MGAVGDRIWFALDHSVPAWDQAEHLTGSLNYWQALQNPQWFSSKWWTSFWQLSSKIPPLTYIAAAVVQNLVGTGPDQATLVELLFSAILLSSVYGLGVQLFSVEVGLWAAGLCQVLPSLYQSRLDFLLDYPLTAVVTLSFWCLTVFGTAEAQTQRRSWLWAAAFGFSFGLALLVKQTALFFLLMPVLWVGVVAIQRRNWGRVFQLVGGLLLSVAVFGPWYRTNWLLVLTAGKRATVDSAIAEGDPALNTLAAWTYYWKIIPYQLSWLLLLVPIVGMLLYRKNSAHLRSLAWLGVFWIGGYLLSSLNINKDARYVLPYLPVLSLFLAYGLTRWGQRIRWGTVGLALVLMFLNLFPVGGVLGNGFTQALSPNAQHYAYVGSVWPHRQVIDEIIKTGPYVRSTLGVLPSTAEINQHNFNYYGALEDFQVYGRQVGTKKKQIAQDARSLDWFLTKNAVQGSVPEAQAAIVQTVEFSPDLQLHKSWNLPDGSNLKLYHRRVPQVEVQPLPTRNLTKATIAFEVAVPDKAPPGIPVPVTYQWFGSWEQLHSGIVLLTWRNSAAPFEQTTNQYRWLHDHSIGMGTLHPGYLTVGSTRRRGIKPGTETTNNEQLTTDARSSEFQVIEHMAMLPPADIPVGTYTLEATYLNRQTGETYPLTVPPVTLKIEPQAAATPAPELDLVTQLRYLGAALPKGGEALGAVFEEIARINQYDPIQDYLEQTELSMEYRLQLEPQNRDWAYTLALSRVLQRQVKGAIAALERVTQLDAQNPYAYAYLAFVHLYDWQASAAEAALKPAIALNPNLPEIQTLKGVAALMQGNLVQAWQTLQKLRKSG